MARIGKQSNQKKKNAEIEIWIGKAYVNSTWEKGSMRRLTGECRNWAKKRRSEEEEGEQETKRNGSIALGGRRRVERNQKEIKTKRDEEIRGATYLILKEESRKIVAPGKNSI